MKDYGAWAIGSDPELSIWTEDGQPSVVCGLLGGTKEKPKRAGKFGHYQEDNVNAEVNPTPSQDWEEVANNIILLKNVVAKKLKPHKLVPKAIPFVEYPVGFEFPEPAKIAGCSPDYNIYTKDVNPSPQLENSRSAGGHLAMQVPRTIPIDAFVKTADVFIGTICAYHDTDKKRQELYGKAGSFRAALINDEFGIVEYRTPSNWWMKDETTIRYMLEQWSKLPSKLTNLSIQYKVTDYKMVDKIRRAINYRYKNVIDDLINDFNMEVL